MTEIDYFILDMLGRHASYQEIVDAALIKLNVVVKYTQINKLHRGHFPT